MEPQQRVTFDFAGDHEVRSVRALPEVGDLVAHGEELWLVRSVDTGHAGIFIRCERPF